MNAIAYAQRRYDAVLREVDRLKQSDFPYEDSRDALIEIEKLFQRQRTALGKLNAASSRAVTNNACSQSLYHLFLYTPFLGFILRSTNVRNAFEAYAPVLRLARELLGPSTKLLLSSEWDYSPFIYLTADLPNFALIGLPAPESSNPLLLSLAGHELGHNIWEQQDFGKKHDSSLRRAVLDALKNPKWAEYNALYPQVKKSDLETDMFARGTWSSAHSWGMLQLEEIFCDAMGMRLFGEAYLHAFAYILAPRMPGERHVYYPNIIKRVEYLERAAKAYSISIPSGYLVGFDSEDEPTDPNRSLLVSTADIAAATLADVVIDEARSFADAKHAPTRDAANTKQICKDFEMVIPAQAPSTMTDILNAGWDCFHKTDLLAEKKQIKPDAKLRVLYDLILKSFEVSEVYERVYSA